MWALKNKSRKKCMYLNTYGRVACIFGWLTGWRTRKSTQLAATYCGKKVGRMWVRMCVFDRSLKFFNSIFCWFFRHFSQYFSTVVNFIHEWTHLLLKDWMIAFYFISAALHIHLHLHTCNHICSQTLIFIWSYASKYHLLYAARVQQQKQQQLYIYEPWCLYLQWKKEIV